MGFGGGVALMRLRRGGIDLSRERRIRDAGHAAIMAAKP
jgi:hypothetical protein